MPQLQQPAVGSLQQLLDQATSVLPWFENAVEQFALQTQGVMMKVATKSDKINTSKPSPRAYEKAAEKGRGLQDPKEGYRYIKDMLRGSVGYPSATAMANAINMLPNHFQVVESKDHVHDPKLGGYVDLNMIIVHPGAHHLCELQLHFNDMLVSKKKKGGHLAYEMERVATQGKSISDLYMTDRKAYGAAQRAIRKGQAAYCKARVEIARDQIGKTRMIGELSLLSGKVNHNCETYMAHLSDYVTPADNRAASAMEAVLA